MMRHSCLFRPISGLLSSILVYTAVTCSVSSCTDDTFNKYQQENTGLLTFDVKVPGNWTNGLSRAATDISIKRMSQSAHTEPLYLVTEISEVAADAAASDAAAEEAATRGSMVNSTDNFHTNFGLSAICYTGTWPDGNPTDWNTDFAHNLEVTQKEGKWQSAEKLNWLGSGGIRFFAYSPYSSSDNGIVHSDKSQGGIPTLTYTVPTDVRKQQDLMTATKDCSGGQGGAVDLQFKHALAAITIKTGKEMLSGEITGITISGVYGKGICQIGAENWKTEDNADCSFSIKEEIKLDENKDDLMTKPGIELNKDEEGYTFMMIPQTLTDNATLTIVFADSISKTPHTLTAKLKEHTKDYKWVAGKKYTYSVNTTGIIVEPIIEVKINRANTLYPNGGQIGIDAMTLKADETSLYSRDMTDDEKLTYLPVSGFLNDVSIVAYTHVVQASAEDKTKEQFRKLDFKIEWSFDGKDWKSGGQDSHNNPMGWHPIATSQTAADDTNWKSPVKGSILLPAQTQFTYMQDFLYGERASIDGTLSRTVTDPGEGTATEPHDLVRNNEVAQESANCYIVNNHGYYTFPAYYGNTYGKDNDTSSYIYDSSEGDIPANVQNLVLPHFVDHNNKSILKGSIDGVADAILLWQDSPDLVTDVKLNDKTPGWVSFRVPKETINQGNAVIAVRNNQRDILWSWHIWVTHRKWNKSSCIQMSDNNLNERNQPFIIAPCNLGYCEPHKGENERSILMRFVVDPKLVGGDGVILNKHIKVTGAPMQSSTEEEAAIITLTQPKITASVAGDNTYYQWGRKDAMLPGVHNEVTRNNGLSGDQKTELDMVNKMFYSSKDFRFTSGETSKSIGESIQLPYQFFIHQRPDSDEKDPINNFKRRHWHDGENAYGKKSIMNYWNIQLIESGNANYFNYDKKDNPDYKQSPNDQYVVKTIYDPSPAGFKIPPIKAFADFFDNVKLKQVPTTEDPNAKKAVAEIPNATHVNSPFDGWKVNINGKDFYFPATGVRDMGIKQRDVKYGTFPAFSSITYIASSGFHNGSSSSCLIFSIDKRNTVKFPDCTTPIDGTNNAYGFTIRPIRDGQTGTGN